ncbi:hypothetical protein L1049_024893 [Liquidambar formosana]|uniref:P-type Ca(2+) transporter n=1 Tax=Liquidambar formosana TaxID=63359 RepID=A0AAP0S277_LIQFO
MESYLNDNFGVKPKGSSEEALKRWRERGGVTKNPKRRFRFTANLAKRDEAAAMRVTNQERLRIAVLVSKAAFQFIPSLTPSEYIVPEEVKVAGFQICADELGSIVEGHDVNKLRVHGGVSGIAEKLSTSITNGLNTNDDSLNRRQEIYGINKFTESQVQSFWVFIWEAFQDKTFMIAAVMARSSPLDKHTLVKHLRTTHDEVVAVTGDRTNDAPALHEADIGLAMGIAGTEVAKESADVIILDDDFSTIVTLAKWGRSVYLNVQKFIQFQLTVNVVALIVNFSSACLTGNVPLTAVQLWWVNMIIDTLGALALVAEPPTDDLMKRSPCWKKRKLISNVMWRNILGQSFYQFVVIWYLQAKGKAIFCLDGADSDLILNTLIFNSFVFCQVFNEINSREMEKINVFKGILENYFFVAVLSGTVFFQIIIIEFLGTFANTSPLTLAQWFLSLFIGFLGMPIAVGLKMINCRNYMNQWCFFNFLINCGSLFSILEL